MNWVKIYKCFCDETRLRILNILRDGPLCVCHVQEILDEPQVKISKQLGYLKRNGVLESRRWNNWTIYQIQDGDSVILEKNLKCLQDGRHEYPVFQSDLKRRETLMARIESGEVTCPAEIKPGNHVASKGGSCGC